MQNFAHNLLNKETKEKFQCYPHMRVNDVHKFDSNPNRCIADITKVIRMDWILSLDVSLYQPRRYNDICFPITLSKMLPYLR